MKRAMASITWVALLLATVTVAMAGPRERVSSNAGEITPAIRDQATIDLLRSTLPKGATEPSTYVGDEFCISCHQWGGITRDVKHRQALRTPMGALSLIDGRGVVADYDQDGVDDFMQGLDFNTISTVFDPYIPNAPILSYNMANDTYWIQIGELTSQVWITQGGTGDWKQRYLMRVPVKGGGWAKDMYVSPLQFNEKTHGYVSYHPEHWWDPTTKAPLLGIGETRSEVAAVGRSYSRRCIGCHTTGISSLFEDPAGEWNYRAFPASLPNPDRPEQYPDYDFDGIADIVNVGCEACHGPGSRHILGGGDPEEILAPSELDTVDANALCQQCHIRVKSVPTGKFGWPRKEGQPQELKAWTPGFTEEPLESFYTLALGLWPDGKTAKQHHQQHPEFYESDKPTFQFHEVRCTECHSPHKGGKHMIVTSIEEDGIVIPTENDNDTLCLACHATHGDFADLTPEQIADYDNNIDAIAEVVEAHTYHPFAPERKMGLSRCSKCHMAKTAKSAINYDIHSHTFEPIAPEKTLTYQEDGGMPNSCAASCHAQKAIILDAAYDPEIATWNAQVDRDLAESLMTWYGPGGLWWDTADPVSFVNRILRVAPKAGIYEHELDTEFD